MYNVLIVQKVLCLSRLVGRSRLSETQITPVYTSTGPETFHWADLWSADLQEADLKCADLRGVDLTGANLEGANLEGADLRFADVDILCFSLTSYKGAKLKHARLSGTIISPIGVQLAKIGAPWIALVWGWDGTIDQSILEDGIRHWFGLAKLCMLGDEDA